MFYRSCQGDRTSSFPGAIAFPQNQAIAPQPSPKCDRPFISLVAPRNRVFQIAFTSEPKSCAKTRFLNPKRYAWRHAARSHVFYFSGKCVREAMRSIIAFRDGFGCDRVLRRSGNSRVRSPKIESIIHAQKLSSCP
ncbi:hypothetical protein [Microseira wollei]|uniref:hypothetical protein n=1 Tax=Microseira wollei TaxID=467598 RepID=UPI001CFC983E|nr:hypothetical protein [Microseira wollei]